MIDKPTIDLTLLKAMRKLSQVSEHGELLNNEFKGHLVGSGGILDSLDTITLFVTIEELLSSEYNLRVNLTELLVRELNNSLKVSELVELIFRLIQE